MLKQRLITAAILIPLVIWAIFSLSSSTINIVFAALALIGAWEWGAMIQLRSVGLRLGYVGLVALVIGALSLLASGSMSVTMAVLVLAVFWWFLSIAWIRRYRGQTGLSSRASAWGAAAGVLVIVPWWFAMSQLHAFGEQGPWWLFFLILLTSVADSGAYFAGRRWGKHKLAPYVSPGKTIEGVGGALVASLIVALVGGVMFGLSWSDLLWFVPLCLVTVAISVVGDLLESLFKRRAGLKDSGHILPGHGGILDRVDSHTAAAPLFALGLTLFGLAQ